MKSPRSFWPFFFYLGSLLFFSTAFASVPVEIDRPLVEGASMSEDGHYVAYLTPKGKDYYDLNIYDVEKNDAQKLDLKGDDVMRIKWADAGRLVVITRNYPEYAFRVQVLNVPERRITENLNTAEQYFRFIGSIRRSPDLFTVYFPDDGAPDGLATISSKRKPVKTMGATDPRFNVTDWVKLPKGDLRSWKPDADGEIRVVQMYHEQAQRLHVRPTVNAPWTPLPYDPNLCTVVGFTNDPDLIYLALYTRENRSSRLHRYRISTGELGPVLFEDPDYSLTGASLLSCRQRDGKQRLLCIDYHREVPIQRALDPAFGEIQKALNQLLPGRLNMVVSTDQDLQRILFSTTNGREPRRFGLYNQGTKKIFLLPDPAPHLDPKRHSVMRPLKYTARDGLVLEGYLSLPAQLPEGAKPPLVVLPHGGPWVRDTWGYDLDIQILTSRGYAVFQPNYRGSEGYARSVSIDDEFEFRKMHDDVTDGVKYLLSLGQVDAQRVAIYGSSFGGYLAICGAAYEPDLYRCAITFAGIFDWRLHLKHVWTESHRHSDVYELFLKKLGDPKIDAERFERFSPITQIARIKVPVFVGHGVMDRTVDIEQSRKLLSELAAHHVPHESRIFGEEGHGFSENENQEGWLTALVTFLEKNL